MDACITIATVLVMFGVLLFTKLRSDLVFFALSPSCSQYP